MREECRVLKSRCHPRHSRTPGLPATMRHQGEFEVPKFVPITGRCQCGVVRYTIQAPAIELYHCHCSICRRSHGTIFATYATVPRDKLVIERGADNLATYSSSAVVQRHFCRTCGCQLILDDQRWPHLRWYTPGTCDGHPGHLPGSEKHIFVGSKVPWYRISDDLPRREEF